MHQIQHPSAKFELQLHFIMTQFTAYLCQITKTTNTVKIKGEIGSSLLEKMFSEWSLFTQSRAGPVGPVCPTGVCLSKLGSTKMKKYYFMWFSYLTLKLPTHLHSLHRLNLCLGNLITWIQAQKDGGHAGLGKEKSPPKNSQEDFCLTVFDCSLD